MKEIKKEGGEEGIMVSGDDRSTEKGPQPERRLTELHSEPEALAHRKKRSAGFWKEERKTRKRE